LETFQAIFAAEAGYPFFRDALVEAAERFGIAIHAYVWMTNHIHLLATPSRDDSIGKTLQSVGGAMCSISMTPIGAAVRFGRDGIGTVVDSEQYLLTLMHYIEMNPVRPGRAASPADYPLVKSSSQCPW